MLKNTLLKHAILAGGLMLTPGFVMAQNDWVPSGTPITIPFDAIVGGHDTSIFPPLLGPPLYVCRTGRFSGYDQQVGKFKNGFSGCDFGFGGREVAVPGFEFLVADWVPASFGEIPGNAVVGGQDTPPPGQFAGPTLYYCRAKVAGPDLQLGKIRGDFGGCFIPYGGSEHIETQYEVLVSGIPYHTVGASNGVVPPDAIRGGHDDDGTDLYVCSAYFSGGIHPGKLRSSFRGCDISYGGKEYNVVSYNVLVPDWYSTGELDFQAGTDVGGFPLYVCRAHYNGGLQPGKTRTTWSTCNFGYGGKETTVSRFNYDILGDPPPIR
jgi:Protein of unknown function (DUF3421)